MATHMPASGPRNPPRTRMPGAERRELIVDAALREFASLGYEGASMGRIAAAAGISRTVLYDHFPSKHALFVSLLHEEHAALLAWLRESIASGASMRERMRLTYDAYFRFAEERPLAWRLLNPEYPPLDDAVATAHRRCRSESTRALAALLEPDARAAGLDPESRIGAAFFAIHQEALHGGVRWWQAHPEVTRAELVEAAMEALWSGLGGPRRSSPSAR